MEFPCPPVWGNLRSGKFPSVLILATSSSAEAKADRERETEQHTEKTFLKWKKQRIRFQDPKMVQPTQHNTTLCPANHLETVFFVLACATPALQQADWNSCDRPGESGCRRLDGARRVACPATSQRNTLVQFSCSASYFSLLTLFGTILLLQTNSDLGSHSLEASWRRCVSYKRAILPVTLNDNISKCK